MARQSPEYHTLASDHVGAPDHVGGPDHEQDEVPSIDETVNPRFSRFILNERAPIDQPRARPKVAATRGAPLANGWRHAIMVVRFRTWREACRTREALRHLDDRQLREFGIATRPRDLARNEFP